ncbi:hypothetical protein [Winogradskyella sp. PC D3.3]
MKLLRRASYASALAIALSFTVQCSSSKVDTSVFEESTPFKVEPVTFQEWFAGIKVGGTGINIFVPVANKSAHVIIDSIYFRNLKGKLVHKNDKYVAVLKNNNPYYTFTKAEKPQDYPFDLADAECAISFVENGETKYVKITDLNEVTGIYYEDGPPSIYNNTSSTDVASAIDDNE